MKIAFNHEIFCLQGYGGISRYFARLAEQLTLTHNTKIFTGLHQNYYLQDFPTKVVCGKYVNYTKRHIRKLKKMNNTFAHMGIKLWQPDIVHQTYYYDLYQYNKPTVTTIHDMIHELYCNEFPPNDITADCKKKIANNASHIIAISQSTKKDLIELLGIDENKISVIYHGFDRFDDKELVTPIFKNPYLLYVGHRSGYKNFENLIKALAFGGLMKDVELVAFGGGTWTMQELQLFQKLNINQQKIHQIGGNDSILANLYKNAMAFIYPSKYEGFGIPPLEAMALNCPVISSNTSSMPEVIGDAGHYFNPNDVDFIIQSIREVVYDDKLKSTLIKLGNERLKMFSWQKCAEQTLEVYNKLS